MSLRNWQRISRRLVYKNPWIKLWEDKVVRPDGEKGIYGFLEKPPGVFIIALDGNDDSIYLLKQFRYTINKSIYELPAGVINDPDLLMNAKRELKEETGITANRWQHLGEFYVAPGHETIKIHAFLATDLIDNSIKADGQDGDEAILKIIKVKVSDLPMMIRQGKIECGITLASLNLFLNR
jgi:8-oxo-dGTP pyrophosphatase MutT (NUDIX family)